MIDNELFELCKEVYRQTNWSGTLDYFEDYPALGDVITKRSFSGIPNNLPDLITPLYTSDYLLEKLPPVIFTRTSDGHNPTGILTVWINGDKTAHAAYVIPYDEQHRADHAQTSDTPLKALLKLTLSLNKAGVEL